MLEHRFDIVVVGAGPGGLAAACSAAESGAHVAMIDENAGPGGQIWRSTPDGPVAVWSERAASARVKCFYATTVFDIRSDHTLVATTHPGACCLFTGKRVVLAVGARELLLPFPGWTLPNVVGVGGIQALAKGGVPIAGKTVVIAGTGPLLLAAARYMQRRGAIVPAVVEQADASPVLKFGATLWRHPRKLAHAIAMRSELLGTRFYYGAWPVRAHGNGTVRSATFNDGSREWSVDCDYFACGFGLVPNLQLPQAMGCRVECLPSERPHLTRVLVDEFQHTSVPGVYCAGEPAGIGGVDVAMTEGLIAGYAAANNHHAARELFARRAHERSFSSHLNTVFALRKELLSLATDDTIVCRCEDVRQAEIACRSGWRDAKLKTRCGMGACQGRVCGAALSFTMGWKPPTPRAPLVPVTVGMLADSTGIQ